MNGGNLPDDFWTRLDDKFKGIYDKIDATNKMINEIRAYGCAQRPGDIERIKDLESWRTRGIIGVISAMFTALGSLILALFAQGK